MVIFANFRDSELLNSGKFWNWKLPKFTRNQNSEPKKIVQNDFF